MSENSPMMRRMRPGKFPRFNVPKKGRLRFVLIIALILIVVKVSGNLFTKSPDNGPVPKSVMVKTPEHKTSGESGNKQGEAPRSPLFYGEVFDLLKENPPSFKSNLDSVTYRGENLVVHYSLDTSLQQFGYSLMKRYNPLYGAIVAIQPNTGRVLAFLSYKNDSVPDLGNLTCRSIFPAASVYKTITAATAIETAGFTSQSMVKHVGRNHTLYMFQLKKELKEYREISFEKAYAQSINPVFARIGMYSIPRGAMRQYGLKFGFNTAIPFELPIEKSHMETPDSLFNIAELASGFNQETTMSPILGALIVSAISEQGRMPRPVLVDSITSSNSCVYKNQNQIWRIPIKEKTSRVLREMMKGVSHYGTARKSFKYIRQSNRFEGIEYGGKTGSVDKDSIGRVDWFIGYARSPYDTLQRLAVGVLTVHGAFWTVHSSFIAAELIRVHLRAIQTAQEKAQKELSAVVQNK